MLLERFNYKNRNGNPVQSRCKRSRNSETSTRHKGEEEFAQPLQARSLKKFFPDEKTAGCGPLSTPFLVPQLQWLKRRSLFLFVLSQNMVVWGCLVRSVRLPISWRSWSWMKKSCVGEVVEMRGEFVNSKTLIVWLFRFVSPKYPLLCVRTTAKDGLVYKKSLNSKDDQIEKTKQKLVAGSQVLSLLFSVITRGKQRPTKEKHAWGNKCLCEAKRPEILAPKSFQRYPPWVCLWCASVSTNSLVREEEVKARTPRLAMQNMWKLKRSQDAPW